MDYVKAMSLIEDYLEMQTTTIGEPLSIVEDATIQKPYGWIFFYNTRKCIETNDMRHSLAGNGPVIIEGSNDSIHAFGSALSPDEYIEQYERMYHPELNT